LGSKIKYHKGQRSEGHSSSRRDASNPDNLRGGKKSVRAVRTAAEEDCELPKAEKEREER